MVKFGWLSPVAGHAGSNFEPIVMYQERHILPMALRFFDSVWIADHFYGFDKEKTEGFLEGWTTLTWLAAKFPDVMLCHHVLGHGYRNPALIAKMASTLQVLSGGRFMLGIGGGWREDEYPSYGYEFPPGIGATASARGSGADLPADVDRAAPHVPRRVLHDRRRRRHAAPRRRATDLHRWQGRAVALPVVGRCADMWNTSFPSEDEWKRKRAIVDAAAEAAGRDQPTSRAASPLPAISRTPTRRPSSGSRRVRHLDELGIDARRLRLRPSARPRARGAVRRAGDHTASFLTRGHGGAFPEKLSGVCRIRPSPFVEMARGSNRLPPTGEESPCPPPFATTTHHQPYRGASPHHACSCTLGRRRRVRRRRRRRDDADRRRRPRRRRSARDRQRP